MPDYTISFKVVSLAEERKIRLNLLDDVKSTISPLLVGRADCTIASRIPFAWYIRQMKETGEYQKIDKGVILREVAVISSNDGYLAYTDIDDEKNFPYKKDFSIKFDIEIYKMKKNGEIQEIVNKFVK